MVNRIAFPRILILLLLLAAAVRLFHIQTQSIWFDEGWSAYAAVQPTLIDAINADATNPPLYYLLLNISTRFLGDSEFALRFFSLAWGLIGIALAYRLGRVLFNARAGVFAALLVAVNPLMWWAAQEARMYTLLAALVLITTLGFHSLLRGGTWRGWLMLWGGELALLYAHNTGPVIALWLNVAVVAAWITKLRKKEKRQSSTESWRVRMVSVIKTLHPDARWWIIGQIGIGLLWLPYFVARFLLLSDANSALFTPPEWSLRLFWHLWESLWSTSWLMVTQEPTITLFSAVLFLIAFATFRWRSANARWLLLHTLLLTGGLLLGLTVLGNHIHARYMVMIAPLPLVAIGAGLARLPLFWRLRTGDMPVMFPRYAAAVIFVAVLPLSIALLAQTPGYQHDDARGMVGWYADNLTADDTVLAWSYADRYDLWYYWERLGVTARRVTLPEGADVDQITPLLPTSGRVALNVWYTQRADYRGMLDCVFNHANVPALRTPHVTFNGMSTNLYPATTFSSEQNPFDGRFAIGQITTIGTLPEDLTAEEYLCLPLHFVPSHAVEDSLRVRITIRDARGIEAGNAEGILATANQRTKVQAGERLTAYPVIRLFEGSPPGDYAVYVRVYDDAQRSGYDVLDENGTALGKDLLLGTWRVLPGAVWDLPYPNQIRDMGVQVFAQNRNTTFYNGDTVQQILYWVTDEPLPRLTFAATDGSWAFYVPSHIEKHDSFTREVREFQIPAFAQSGTAELRLPDGTPIITYTIQYRPGLFSAPYYAVASDTVFPGVGTLVGYTVETDPLDHTQPAVVTLIWNTGDSTPTTDYTVFVQLLDSSGILIAQSDALPAQNTRPTTTWLPGEYIVDTHTLTFNQRAAPGEVTLIAGLYTTQGRMQLPSGADFVTLAEGLLLR